MTKLFAKIFLLKEGLFINKMSLIITFSSCISYCNFVFIYFLGHNGALNSSTWSHHNQWLLTTSDDKTARIWTRGIADPVMTFDRVNNNFDSDKEKATTGDKVRIIAEGVV